MPSYRVEALESFFHKTVYYVNADTFKAAEVACRKGRVAYSESTVEDDQGEWIETLSIEESNSPGDDPEPEKS